MEARPIKKKILIGVRLRLVEPMCVSGGEASHSDRDVILDGKGKPFIPGTSLAGAFRNYLRLEKDQEGMFGFAKKNGNGSKEDGAMSVLTVSDIRQEEDCQTDIRQKKGWQTEIRDGVRLEEKVAQKEGKYDMQVVSADAMGSFYLEATIRQGDNEEEMISLIRRFLSGLNLGEIRLGSSKNRGYGRVEICRVIKKEFTKDNRQDWLSFDYNRNLLDELKNEKSEYIWDYQEDLSGQKRYHIFEIPLQLTGGISIRKYSARPMEADFEQLSHRGQAIIPGTSWAGAIRSRCREILYSLGTEGDEEYLFRANALMERAFGKVKNKVEKEDDSRQSCVVIGESRITGGQNVHMTRNKIDRFSNATVDGALYTEKAYFQGKTMLRIMIERPHDKEKPEEKKKELLEMQAVTGLILLTVEDIKHGFLAVGGQTAVGRGIFRCTSEKQESHEKYMKALYIYLRKEA